MMPMLSQTVAFRGELESGEALLRLIPARPAQGWNDIEVLLRFFV